MTRAPAGWFTSFSSNWPHPAVFTASGVRLKSFSRHFLGDFRKIAAADANCWRTCRLVLEPAEGQSWQDREIYNGRWRDAPISLLYRQASRDFLTACNLARLLGADALAEALKDAMLSVRGDDGIARDLTIAAVSDAGPLPYHPVIPFDVSPARFRVLVPLAAASACVERAIAAWNERFARVWDRLPLRAGLVAFPRMVPFQAVIEAARNLENELDDAKPECWRIADRDVRDTVLTLHLKRPDGRCELRTMPVTLPDGRTDVFYPYFAADSPGWPFATPSSGRRTDVFYPYFAAEDQQVRFPRDFQHPHGQVFRHAEDLTRRRD